MKKFIKKFLRHTLYGLTGRYFTDLEKQNTFIMDMLKKGGQNTDQNYRDLMDLVVGAK